MSFGGKANLPTKSPKPAGIDGNDTSTNEQAVPVPWWIGPDWRPLTWIVPDVYNQRSVPIVQNVGSGKSSKNQTVGYKYYGDVAGIAGLGVVSRIRGFESNGEVVWTGSIPRPDDPEHPDYWRTKITTSVADVYVYWGRPDQPIDDILLSVLGDADPALKHPAYRNQVLVVLVNYFLGDSGGSVPNTRLLLDRAPLPDVGTFAPQDHAQGESMVAGITELATSQIFGAGIPIVRFTDDELEALSAAVIARVGRHAPSLDRARPIRDVIKDFQTYYDGWSRIENGMLRFGYFPHDGTVPSGLTELSVHDFTERPRVKATTPSKSVNDVVVVYRDGADQLKKKSASESASDNVEARRNHESRQVEMLGIIDRGQASAFAAEAANTGSEGEFEGELKVRRPRALWASGDPLQAGDNFNLDLIAPEVDQVSRITRRTDPYAGEPMLEFMAERGVYPTPYIAPADLRPDVGKIFPNAIEDARILELTPALAGTPLGLPIAFLAKRPPSEFAGAALSAGNVLGLVVNFSTTGSSYDTIGSTIGWGIRGTLNALLAADAGDVTVQVAMDADNLDLARLRAQSAASQDNDNLLLIVGDEIFSVGAISLVGLNYQYACKRARLGSLAAAHAAAAETWLIYRDELRSFTHKRFVEDEDRYFKLQPYTQSATIELAEIDPLTYHFRDRADELPVIVINAVPANMKVGVTYNISGSISDVNGDLANYQVNAARIVAGEIDSEITLLAGDVAPDDKALLTFKAPVVWPQTGTWRIVVRAYDERVGFKVAETADFTVAAGNTLYTGPDDGVTPDPVTDVVLTAGLGVIFIDFTFPTNTPVLQALIYEAATAVQPVNWSFIAPASQPFYVRDKLPASTAKFYWIKVQAINGRFSTVAGPFTTTTRAGIDLSDILPGMELVGIVGALPNPVGYTGPKTVLLTTVGKLYRYSAGAWTTAVPTVDLTGQIISGQIADAAVLNAKLADNAVSQVKLLDGIVSTSKLVDAAITEVKIASGSIITSKLAAGAVTTNELAAGSVTAAKIGAGEIVTSKLAAGAVTANELAANSVTAAKIAAGEVTTAKIAAGAITTAELAADSVVAGKIAAAAITAAAVGANEIIANTANIAAAIVTGAKIADATIGTAKIIDANITTLKVAGNAITAPTAVTGGTVSALANGVATLVIAASVAMNTGESASIGVSFGLADDGPANTPDCDIFIYAVDGVGSRLVHFQEWSVATGGTELISVAGADVNIPSPCIGYHVYLRPRNGGASATPSCRSPNIVVMHTKR